MKKFLLIVLAILMIATAAACVPAVPVSNDAPQDVQEETLPKADPAQPEPEPENPEMEPGDEQGAKPDAQDLPDQDMPKPDTAQPETIDSNFITVVVAFVDFQDEEFAGVADAIEASGYRMNVVSVQGGEATGMYGGTIEIKDTIKHVEDYGLGVVVIGGSGCHVLWDNADLISLVQRVDSDDSLVAAICAAPGVLASAGVLEGGQACWSNSPDLDAIMAGVSCEDTGALVTEYENIITGQGPEAAIEFGKAIIDYLGGM